MLWAQSGNNPWVEASVRLMDLKSVTKSMPLCAELFPLSRVFPDKDWIDLG